MRILYHHRTLGDGAEGIHINEMVRAFRALGHDVKVVALIGDPTVGSNDEVVKPSLNGWSSIGSLLPGITYELAELGYNLLGIQSMRRAIREFSPDLIYDRYNTFSTSAIDAAKKRRIPVLLEVNAPAAYERTEYERRPLRLRRMAERFESRICNAADHVFAVSTPLKNFLIAERGVPESRVSVLPNGADPATFSPSLSGSPVRRRLGVDGKTVIGFAGILRPWHGVDLLLEAFADLASQDPLVHLLIVGDGPVESSLKTHCRQWGLESAVSFTGRVPHAEMNSYLAAMDIAVSPSATFYASPMKILEYMAMGIATVAPDMTNIRDIVRNRENGLLFEPGSRESLFKALTKLIHSPELSKRIGARGRKTIETDRNWRCIAQVVLQKAYDRGLLKAAS